MHLQTKLLVDLPGKSGHRIARLRRVMIAVQPRMRWADEAERRVPLTFVVEQTFVAPWITGHWRRRGAAGTWCSRIASRGRSVHELLVGLSRNQSSIAGFQDGLGAHVVGESPADHLAVVEVEDSRSCAVAGATRCSRMDPVLS
jgi:hypothetical protein